MLPTPLRVDIMRGNPMERGGSHAQRRRDVEVIPGVEPAFGIFVAMILLAMAWHPKRRRM